MHGVYFDLNINSNEKTEMKSPAIMYVFVEI